MQKKKSYKLQDNIIFNNIKYVIIVFKQLSDDRFFFVVKKIQV